MKITFEFNSLDELDTFIVDQFERRKYINKLQKNCRKIPLKDLDLSETVLSTFEDNGIYYLEDVFRFSLHDLQNMKGISKNTLKQIMQMKTLYDILVI
jgi:DNA-directed RNA polymerase alpha subunit